MFREIVEEHTKNSHKKTTPRLQGWLLIHNSRLSLILSDFLQDVTIAIGYL